MHPEKWLAKAVHFVTMQEKLAGMKDVFGCCASSVGGCAQPLLGNP